MRMAADFKSSSTSTKLQLFQLIAHNSAMNKQSKGLQYIVNDLLLEATNLYNSFPLRQQTNRTLKSSLFCDATFDMLEKLNNLEEEIRREIYGINDSRDVIFQTHVKSAVAKIQYIIKRLINDFHSYHFEGVPFDQEDVMRRTRVILKDADTIEKAFVGLGEEEVDGYLSQANDNLLHLETVKKDFWTTTSNEWSSLSVNGLPITAGQVYSLVIYYIERQKSKESYVFLVGGLVQALSSEAMKGCAAGAISQIGNTIFKEEFKQEGIKEARSYRDYIEVVSTKLGKMKAIMIELLLQYSTNGIPFDVNADIFKNVYPEISKNALMIETFTIFNHSPMKQILGDKLNQIDIIFKKATPNNEEEKFIHYVHALIINPVLLALLSKHYSDFVVFTVPDRQDRMVIQGDPTKLSFPEYTKILETEF